MNANLSPGQTTTYTVTLPIEAHLRCSFGGNNNESYLLVNMRNYDKTLYIKNMSDVTEKTVFIVWVSFCF